MIIRLTSVRKGALRVPAKDFCMTNRMKGMDLNGVLENAIMENTERHGKTKTIKEFKISLFSVLNKSF